MKHKSILAAAIVALAFCLTACNGAVSPTEPMTQTHSASTATLPTETEVPHSALYVENLDIKNVIQYFNEVCLDAEFVNSGNASLLQKWEEPICYRLNGDPTDKDLEVINNFTAWLNTIDGFPGISEAQETQTPNLQIHFCTRTELLSLMGDNFANTDGAVTFWYRNNAIYDEIICYRNDIDQFIRNSVILEEIYNGLGPVQDTSLRADSVIYSGYSEPQQLTGIDELILRLLYHPDMKCGMNAQECEAVIRQLYY